MTRASRSNRGVAQTGLRMLRTTAARGTRQALGADAPQAERGERVQ